MPNHVTNQITFGTDDASAAAFQQMLQEVQAGNEPLGSFDFNKLIPVPQELNIEHSSRTDAGRKLFTTFLKETANLAKETMLAAEDVHSAAFAKH